MAERVQEKVPLVTGTGRDVADAALHLAPDEAKYVTGTEILVDGGLTLKSE